MDESAFSVMYSPRGVVEAAGGLDMLVPDAYKCVKESFYGKNLLVVSWRCTKVVLCLKDASCITRVVNVRTPIIFKHLQRIR